MVKRALWLWLLITLVSLPTAAQDETNVLDWIPADFAGYLRVDLENTSDALITYNIGTYISSFIQPDRITFQQAPGLEAILPLGTLDAEEFSFAQDIFPWLAGEVVLAYKEFGPNLQSEADNMVMIFPTDDLLQSAGNLSRIIQAQDLLDTEPYRDLTLYLADKTTLAFTEQAVLAGPTELVQELLDLQAGEGEHLLDDPAYSQVKAASPDDALLSGYVRGSEILPVLSYLANGDDSALPLLSTVAAVLQNYQGDAGFEQILLGDEVAGVGFNIWSNTLQLNAFEMTLTLFTAAEAVPLRSGVVSADVLNLLPQNAMIVHSGTQADAALVNFISLLPLANFSREIFGAFPIPEAPDDSALMVPTAEDLERAVDGFLTTLIQAGNIDLEADLLRHLEGSYLVVLLPRPNNPLPQLNLPYDVLIVAEVSDPEVVKTAGERLVKLLLPLNELETTTLSGLDFSTIQPDPIEEPVLHFGTVDNLLVIATGGALEPALDARRGNNRLISRDRWQAVSDDDVPTLYVDIPAFYSTFLPELTGPRLQGIQQMALRTADMGAGLYQVVVKVTLPSQFG